MRIGRGYERRAIIFYKNEILNQVLKSAHLYTFINYIIDLDQTFNKTLKQIGSVNL